jgi:aspartyl/asparaginyl-tRNA synthetase
MSKSAMTQRTKIAALLQTEPVNTEVLVKGWVKAFRNNQFIALNDGSCPQNLQVVVDFENTDPALLDRIKFGAAIGARGTLIESQGKGQKIELKATEIEIYGDCNPEEFPLQPKKQSLEFLRENAHLRFRTNTFAAVFRIRHALAFAIHKFFNDRGFFYLHTPIITASDAEGAGEMFHVTTLDLKYVPFSNEQFSRAAEDYYLKLIEFLEKNDPNYRGIINSIEKKLKKIEPNLTFKHVIISNIADLTKLVENKAFVENREIRLEFNKLLNIAQIFGFFETKLNSRHSIIYYFQEWLIEKINKRKKDKAIIAGRIFGRKPYPSLSLSFFNYTFVDRELRGLPSEQREIVFSSDFFGRPTNLTVSGQLEGELGAMALGDIYTFGPTFRAENSNTTRHLAEFWMIEPEVAFADLNDNMNLAEDMLQYVIRYALEHCAEDLKILEERLTEEEKSKPQDQRSELSLTDKLRFVTDNQFERLTYTEAIDILKNSNPNKKGKFQYTIEGWGADLQSEHERYLVEKHFKKPVILTDYPKDIKAFYMRLNEDGKTVRAMDILFPGIGEIVGGSQREERLENLLKRMQEMHIPEKELWWYLDTRRFGSCPHAGFGLGFERLILFVTGMTNIRDVIAFPRFPGSAEF